MKSMKEGYPISVCLEMSTEQPTSTHYHNQKANKITCMRFQVLITVTVQSDIRSGRNLLATAIFTFSNVMILQ